MGKRATAQPELPAWRLAFAWRGCTVIFVGSRYFCLLGSLSPKRILKVMFYCCVPIKMSIIQARVIMTYSLLYLFFFFWF